VGISDPALECRKPRKPVCANAEASALATAYRQVQADAVRWRSLRLPRLRPWRYEIEVGDSAKRRLSDRFDQNI
jgi:hypothetical protein